MKLRLTHNSVRLRLDDADLAALADAGRVDVEVGVDANGGRTFRYSVAASSDIDVVTPILREFELEIRIPHEMAIKLAADPSEGIAILGDGSALTIVVERDLRSSLSGGSYNLR
jgi:hypothetical protein